MNLLDTPIESLMNKLRSKVSNSKKAGLETELSSISIRELIDIIGNGTCAYTGEEFKDLQDATFERINPNKGYINGNVVMVKASVNNIKGVTLDRFVKDKTLTDECKIKLLRKVTYQLEKKLKV